MKKNSILSIGILIGILLTAQMIFAQSYDPSSKSSHQLKINEKGHVLDSHGTKLGYISKEDMVYNNQGKKLGYIKNGKVYDGQDNPLGMVEKGGRYYNNDGVFILETKDIGNKCEILDPNGHNMGTVHKNYKLHACAIHCFFMEKEMSDGMEKK